jgi:hypothetical protein
MLISYFGLVLSFFSIIGAPLPRVHLSLVLVLVGKDASAESSRVEAIPTATENVRKMVPPHPLFLQEEHASSPDCWTKTESDAHA